MDNLKKFLKENFLLIFGSQIYLDGVKYNAKETRKIENCIYPAEFVHYCNA
ncbi:hypothetical protein [Wolbachia endosymbiont (group A) of Ennomos erosarius]|uniref:hypothetical protein n=1 Tax=Wolbachia endosymbiont (group A) of Ennomos erosarius TaxID=3066174 RepID=UPI0033405F1C